jgi:Glycosyl transferase family 2
MTSSASIALFIYARPDHLRRTITSLQNCPGFAESLIYVFADGPKKPEQRAMVEATRDVAKSMLGDRAVFRLADSNKGLARSIIDGVGELTEKHGKVIVIEDDLILAPQFLSYMNAALDEFEDSENVLQVSGHMFDVPEFKNRQYAVMPVTTTWGWATWRRAWVHFDQTCSGWERLSQDRTLRRRFNLNGSYDYATMLEKQMRYDMDSWGIRWYWSVFQKSGLTVFPPRTLVNNDGVDGSGSHGRGVFRRFGNATTTDTHVPTLPQPILDDTATAAVFKAIFRQNGGVLGKIVDVMKRYLR